MMPIQLSEESEGKVLNIHVSGRLAKEDYAGFVPEFERLVEEHGRLRVLFDMTGLIGWDPAALWEEMKFDVNHFSDMERVAAVGDKKWEEVMTAVYNPFTSAKMRYFDQADIDHARSWLESEEPD